MRRNFYIQYMLMFAIHASHHRLFHQPAPPSTASSPLSTKAIDQSFIAPDGMRTELEFLINESQSLFIQTQEYQQHFNALNHEYHESRKQLIVCLTEKNREIDWKPDPWIPLNLPDDVESPPKDPRGRPRRFKVIKSGTSPQLPSQCIDPIEALFTKMMQIQNEMNSTNYKMTHNIEAKKALDETIENLLRKWSLNQHSDTDHHLDLLEKEINLPALPRPMPPSKRRQETKQRLRDIERSQVIPQHVNQTVDSVAYFKELLAKYRTMIRESRILKQKIDNTDANDPLHLVHSSKYNLLQADIQALETFLRNKNFF